MDCQHCGKELEMKVTMVVTCPSSLEGKFSKTNLKKKEVKIEAVNWDTAKYRCPNGCLT